MRVAFGAGGWSSRGLVSRVMIFDHSLRSLRILQITAKSGLSRHSLQICEIGSLLSSHKTTNKIANSCKREGGWQALRRLGYDTFRFCPPPSHMVSRFSFTSPMPEVSKVAFKTPIDGRDKAFLKPPLTRTGPASPLLISCPDGFCGKKLTS